MAMNLSGKLSGKNAVVLGAAGDNNMGQVIARRLIAEGARVVVAGRKREHLDRFVAAHPGQAFAALCDITSKDDNEKLAAEAMEKLGGVDIAINSTGWGLMKAFLETTPEEIEKISDLQFKGPFMFFQAVIGAMKNGGSIIQISSATATIMLNDHAAYMGTKAGTDHVIRCIAHEFGERNIRANSISPGITDTPMTADSMATPGLMEAFLPCYPLGRVGTSDDIASAAVWLCQDDCFLTGQNLQVNGGLTLRRNPMRAEVVASIMSSMPAA